VSNPSTQDLLIFVGVPLAVVGIVFALVYASGGRSAKRYRPGRPYHYAPVWFLARPEADGPAAISSGSSGAQHRQLTASDASVATVASTDAAVAAREHPGLTGGASDRW
jgi:hypothetical protein